MKWLQNGNLAKLVAFFVIAVVITCTVSFAANGWQSFIKNEPDSDEVMPDNDSANNNIDENNDGTQDADTPVVQDKFYHAITGLETELESTLKKPIAICLESSTPLYGISSSYLTIEFPTEDGNTRFLCFSDEVTSLGKIGSLAPSRGYISNLVSFYGGILLSYGIDDSFKYDYKAPGSVLDFKATTGYCYTEYNSFVYTNGDLVNALMNNSSISQANSETPKLPYDFIDCDKNVALNGKKAEAISISFSGSSSTLLNYSATTNKYQLTKNNSVKKDLLNDRPLTYDNVFILYADSVTHETESSTQLIMNTGDSGTGIYATNGQYIEITWIADSNGELTMYDSEGNRLTVNRGYSYIAYVKSSQKSSVKIS